MLSTTSLCVPSVTPRFPSATKNHITNIDLENDNEWYKGAGVARLELIDDVPTVTERLGDQGWWWDGDTQAKYGDVAAYRDVNSDWIYVLGNPPNQVSAQGFPACWYIYQARVRAADAFDLSQYEYWWGREPGRCTSRRGSPGR